MTTSTIRSAVLVGATAALSFGLPSAARSDALPAHVHGGESKSDKDAAAPLHQEHPMDKNAPKPQGSTINLQIGDQSAIAYLAKPKGKARGALLLLHEYWGLNDWVKHQADVLAKSGYLALAVDLYKGKVATDPAEAGKLMQAKDQKWSDQVEHAGLEWIRANAAGVKVGTIGWCMGGGESLNASLNDPKYVNATVMYYGMPVTDVARLKTLQGPVLGIWAKKDGWITPDKVAAFDKALTEAGIPHEFHSYDADHAFANPSSGRYQPQAAKDAWKKTEAFLAANLAK
jgi:carboxymethylenebutenolidase